MAHLVGRPRHAFGDDFVTVLGAGAKPALELGGRGRKDEDTDEIVAGVLGELLGALPVYVEQRILARRQCLLHRGAQGAVVVAENLGIFEKFLAVDHQVELGEIDEVVVLAGDLSGTLGAGRGRHRHRQVDLPLEKTAGNRRLARPRWRGKHQHQPPAMYLENFHGHESYSIFWTCSRNCSITLLSSRPTRVSSRLSDFEHSVLASRLNSWARKSRRRPTGPPSPISSPAAA